MTAPVRITVPQSPGNLPCREAAEPDPDTAGNINEGQSPGEEVAKLRVEVSRLSRERALLEEENRLFRSFLQKSPNPLCFVDVNGIITFANKAFSTSFCSCAGQAQGKELFPLFPEAWITKFRQVLDKLTPDVPHGNTGSIPYEEVEIWRWELSASFTPSGEITGYQALGLNCKAQESLGKLEAAVGSVFDESPLCLAYAENLKVKRVTPAFCRLLGYPREELVGASLPLRQIFEGCDEVSPIRVKKQLLEDGPSLRETRLRTIEGEIIDVFILIIPLRIDRNRIDHFFFIRNISRRKELEKQRLLTELLLQSSPVVLFQKKDSQNAHLDYVSENVSQFGYTARQLEVPGTDFGALVHPEDLPLLIENDRRNRDAGKQDRENTYRIRRADGEYRWVNEKSRVVPPLEGVPHSTRVGILTDVTDQVETRHALDESHARLQEHVGKLEKAWEQTIGLLAAVTELRDPYTMGHQERVAHLSGAIATEMGLDEMIVQETVRAALVHDIGKIKIPSDFLSKPGKLTKKEFSIIEDHARDGAELLGKIDLPWRIREIVLQHHERLDGSGYPRGLKGEEILLPARIIAVADVVEAMASHRPYRPALGIERALVEVSALSGLLYDVEVVSVCRELFLKKGYCWPQSSVNTAQTEGVVKRRAMMCREVLRGYRRA